MKKYLLLFVMCVASCCLYAQGSIRFLLQPSGAFLSEDNQKYVVAEFVGKSATELFSMVKSNAMSLYNDPDKVMSENGGNMISIYAYCEDMCVVNSMGAQGVYGGHYKLVFRFKDGRIRIDAPSIDEELSMSGGFMTGTIGIPSCVFLSGYAKKVCRGNSEKNKEKKEHLEYIVNNPINYLLGFSKSNDDNW